VKSKTSSTGSKKRLSPSARVIPPAHPSDHLDEFLDAIGGRKQLVELLVVGVNDPSVAEVVGLLLDVQHARKPLATLCRMAQISVADLFAALSRAMLVRAEIKVRAQVEQQIAAITADLLRCAQPHEEPCGVCAGTGTLLPGEPSPNNLRPGMQTCAACRGSGQVRVAADLHRQKLVFDLAHLLPKATGPTVAVQQNVGVSMKPGTVDVEGTLALQRAVTEVLYNGPPVVTEADVVPDTSLEASS
jgi:hypothetical protein